MTRDEAISRLVELSVAKWGEAEREASVERFARECPTVGLALNKLAHWDVNNINEPLAAEARRRMTSSDLAVLRGGVR